MNHTHGTSPAKRKERAAGPPKTTAPQPGCRSKTHTSTGGPRGGGGCASQGGVGWNDTRAAGVRARRTTEPPSRRVAESPSGRAAEPPSWRADESPSRRATEPPPSRRVPLPSRHRELPPSCRREPEQPRRRAARPANRQTSRAAEPPHLQPKYATGTVSKHTDEWP